MRHTPARKLSSIPYIGAAIMIWLIAGLAIAQYAPSTSPPSTDPLFSGESPQDTVVVELTGGLVSSLNFTRVKISETERDSLTIDDPHTDRLINEMLECLTTGEFDKVDCIGFIHYCENPPLFWWDTTYLAVTYDGGGYDTCNWVRWRAGWRAYYTTTTIYYWYLLPQYSPLLQLSDAYATESVNLTMYWGDSLAVTWEYTQSARP